MASRWPYGHHSTLSAVSPTRNHNSRNHQHHPAAAKVTDLEAKMESGSVPVETRINAIADYKVKKLSKKAIARKYGVSDSTVRIQQDEEKQRRSP